MNPADPVPSLDQLRGLHLPGGSAALFRGEIFVAILVGLCAALLVGLARRLWLRMRQTLRRTALAELAAASRLPPEERLVAQASLLRRLVLTLRGEEAAAIRGEAWAGELDRLFRTDYFSRGAGRIFVDGLYAGGARPEPGAVEAELRRLFGRVRGSAR